MSAPVATRLPLDAQRRIDADVPCLQCAYNLRTLHVDAACPECGTAVGRSLQSNRLRFADPDWLQTIWHGLNCLGVVLAIGLLVGLVTAPLDDETSAVVAAPPAAVAVVLGLMGVLKVTAAEPGRLRSEPTFSARRLARGLLLAFLGLLLALLLASPVAPWTQAEWVPLAPMLLGLAGLTALLLHAAHLAGRLPHRLLQRATWVTALSVVVFGGAVWLIGSAMAWDVTAPGRTWLPPMQTLMRWFLWGLGGLIVVGGFTLPLFGWYWWELRRTVRQT